MAAPIQSTLGQCNNTNTTNCNATTAITDQERFPERQTLWQAIRRNTHSRCLCLSLLICSCLTGIFWCQLERINHILINLQWLDGKLFAFAEEDGCDEGIVLLSTMCTFMFYIAYLIECWHSPTRLILLCRLKSHDVYALVEKMRQAQPIIWWRAACYHHVRHSRPVVRYRHDGTYTSTEVTYERVTTHVSGASFHYRDCGVQDISKQLFGLQRFPFTRVYFTKGFAFANERSAREFDQQRSCFFRANERYDRYMEIREGLDLVEVNFPECVIVTGDPQYCPWYSNQLVFWLFSMTLLSWPLRILLEYNTGCVHYQVVKLFGVNYGECESPCPMSRSSTLDNLNNSMIAPSYSEVMLAERVFYLRSCSNSFETANEQPKVKSGLAATTSVEEPTSHCSSCLTLHQPAEERQNKQTHSSTGNSIITGKWHQMSTTTSQPMNPPSYEEVIHCPSLSSISRRESLKNYWHHLVGLFRSSWPMPTMARSATDKDIPKTNHKFATLVRKPWTSFGDIAGNFSNV